MNIWDASVGWETKPLLVLFMTHSSWYLEISILSGKVLYQSMSKRKHSLILNYCRLEKKHWDIFTETVFVGVVI